MIMFAAFQVDSLKGDLGAVFLLLVIIFPNRSSKAHSFYYYWENSDFLFFFFFRLWFCHRWKKKYFCLLFTITFHFFHKLAIFSSFFFFREMDLGLNYNVIVCKNSYSLGGILSNFRKMFLFIFIFYFFVYGQIVFLQRNAPGHEVTRMFRRRFRHSFENFSLHNSPCQKRLT